MTVTTKHGSATLLPPVVAAVARVLEVQGIALEGKHAVVVGWGDLVGKPVATWLLQQGATVTVATRSAEHLGDIVRMGEIVVSGAGAPGLITGAMVQEGAVVVDAGTTSVTGTLKGDVDMDSVAERATAVTPVPGGIGPLTVAMLLRNVVAVAGGLDLVNNEPERHEQ
jgi:methylenetetrahydrofolate dehydrogenase (NADP+)/methenyltetrahydrofolate cyclohydrolase